MAGTIINSVVKLILSELWTRGIVKINTAAVLYVYVGGAPTQLTKSLHVI